MKPGDRVQRRAAAAGAPCGKIVRLRAGLAGPLSIATVKWPDGSMSTEPIAHLRVLPPIRTPATRSPPDAA